MTKRNNTGLLSLFGNQPYYCILGTHLWKNIAVISPKLILITSIQTGLCRPWSTFLTFKPAVAVQHRFHVILVVPGNLGPQKDGPVQFKNTTFLTGGGGRQQQQNPLSHSNCEIATVKVLIRKQFIWRGLVGSFGHNCTQDRCYSWKMFVLNTYLQGIWSNKLKA